MGSQETTVDRNSRQLRNGSPHPLPLSNYTPNDSPHPTGFFLLFSLVLLWIAVIWKVPYPSSLRMLCAVFIDLGSFFWRGHFLLSFLISFSSMFLVKPIELVIRKQCFIGASLMESYHTKYLLDEGLSAGLEWRSASRSIRCSRISTFTLCFSGCLFCHNREYASWKWTGTIIYRLSCSSAESSCCKKREVWVILLTLLYKADGTFMKKICWMAVEDTGVEGSKPGSSRRVLLTVFIKWWVIKGLKTRTEYHFFDNDLGCTNIARLIYLKVCN